MFIALICRSRGIFLYVSPSKMPYMIASADSCSSDLNREKVSFYYISIAVQLFMGCAHAGGIFPIWQCIKIYRQHGSPVWMCINFSAAGVLQAWHGTNVLSKHSLSWTVFWYSCSFVGDKNKLCRGLLSMPPIEYCTVASWICELSPFICDFSSSFEGELYDISWQGSQCSKNLVMPDITDANHESSINIQHETYDNYFVSISQW